MGLSLETYALAKKYADAVAAAGSKEALEKAIQQAVSQSKLYTDEVFSKVTNFKVEIVDSLPSKEIDEHTIYFLKKTSEKETDSYYEYMYINNKWELIGTTELNLDNYWTIDEVKDYVKTQEYVLVKATTAQLGGVKIDGTTIQINNDGVISVKNAYSEEKVQNVIDESFADITAEEINNLFS